MTTTSNRRVLVISPAWIGDIVMAQSLYLALKQQSPGSHVTVVAPDWSTPLLRRMPEVDAVMTLSAGHGSFHWKERYRLARSLRRRGIDQAIVLPGSFKSALIPWLAGIPKRTGFVGEQRYGLLNDIRKLDKVAMPLNVQRYVSLGRPSKSTMPLEPPFPRLVVDPDRIRQLSARFRLNTTVPIVALCPGAEYGPAKQWPAAYFAEVAKAKTAQGWQVWLLGSHKETPIAQEIGMLSNHCCVNLVGNTALDDVVDLISLARHVVTNDSGLMHIAAATGGHVIAIYGSTSDTFTPPLADNSHRLGLDLDCRPCFKRHCPLGHTNCLHQLTPDKVLAILK